ncbi:hypothetical protein OBBRIDRAFT_526706 [Obba rivulosa]|uniref:Uncharacterized protein n=1 Tax=Obba rivulosa TaxID=1052685 RepID=A0A8E2AUT2_9APHY|nr:hypothetical protein OBBRIDRAFT_526706 [Obba rivulosa]
MSEPGYYSGRHGRRRGRRYSLPAMVDRTTDAFRTGFNHSMGGVAIGREAVGGAGMPYGAGAFVQDPRLTGTMYGGGINGAYDGRNVAGSYYGGMPVDQYANGATVVSAQPRAAGVYGAAAPLVIMSPQTTVGGMPMQAGVAPQMVAQGAPLAQPGFSAVMNQYGTAVVPSQSPMAYVRAMVATVRAMVATVRAMVATIRAMVVTVWAMGAAAQVMVATVRAMGAMVRAIVQDMGWELGPTERGHIPGTAGCRCHKARR